MDIKPGSPYDINGACFNADMYVKKVLKVKKSQKPLLYYKYYNIISIIQSCSTKMKLIIKYTTKSFLQDLCIRIYHLEIKLF